MGDKQNRHKTADLVDKMLAVDGLVVQPGMAFKKWLEGRAATTGLKQGVGAAERGAGNSAQGRLEEFSGKQTQKYADDLSKVTGKASQARNRAIDETLKADFPDLNLRYKPQYNPEISSGVAKRGAGTQIGKNSFSSSKELRDTIVHEELHHRWWERGIIDHHPVGSFKEARFYETINRYMRMRGWGE